MAFSNANRSILIAKHPEHAKNLRVIASMLGLLWRQLSDADKNAYKEAYSKQKAEYDATIREYRTANPETITRDDLLARTRRQPGPAKRGRDGDPLNREKPRKALTPFFCFVQHHRATVTKQNPSTKAPEITRMLGEMWRALSDDAKRPYVVQSEHDACRFRRECEQLGIEPPSDKRARLARRKLEAQPLADTVLEQLIRPLPRHDGPRDPRLINCAVNGVHQHRSLHEGGLYQDDRGPRSRSPSDDDSEGPDSDSVYDHHRGEIGVDDAGSSHRISEVAPHAVGDGDGRYDGQGLHHAHSFFGAAATTPSPPLLGAYIDLQGCNG